MAPFCSQTTPTPVFYPRPILYPPSPPSRPCTAPGPTWCPALSGGHDVPGDGVLGSVALSIYMYVVMASSSLGAGGEGGVGGAGRGVVSKLA